MTFDKKAYQKAYQQANRERIRQLNRKSYLKHKEKRDEENRNYYLLHREEILARTKAYTAANREKQRAWQRDANKRRKDRVYAAYGGYICQCCGVTEPSFLSLDHIEGNGGKHRKAVGGNGPVMHAWIIKNNFPPIFQVLCMNCNLARHLNGGICPHKAIERTPAIPQGATNGQGQDRQEQGSSPLQEI